MTEDPTSWTALIAGAIVAAITGIAGFFAARTWKSGGRELALVEALQRDVTSLRDEVVELRGRIEASDRRADRSRAHAWRLHVALAAAAPPGEPWPEDL